MSDQSTLVTVLRHGEVAGPANVLRGRSDDALSETGWQQMHATCATLDPRPDRIISSSLRRCSDFAQQFAAQHALPLTIHDDLREIDFGDWELLSTEQARVASPELFERFHTDPQGITPPGGEAFDDFRQRTLTAFDACIEQASGDHLLLITHAGVMRVLLSSFLNLSWADAWRIALPPAGSFRLSCLPGHPSYLLNLNASCAA